MSRTGKYPNWSATGSPVANARRVLPELTAAFFAMGREVCDSDPSPADLHRLRLAGKRLRYCLELFRGIYGRSMKKRLRMLRVIQRRLGVVSDCDATRDLLKTRELRARSDTERLLAFLDVRRSENEEAFLRYWRDRFDAPGEECAWMDFLASVSDEDRA